MFLSLNFLEVKFSYCLGGKIILIANLFGVAESQRSHWMGSTLLLMLGMGLEDFLQ